MYKFYLIFSALALFVLPVSVLSQVIHEKKVLLEEFTTINTEEAAEQSEHLDSIAKSFFIETVLRIKYHTDFEGPDTFYNAAKSGVDKRLEKYGFVESVPQVVVDGTIRPEGDLPIGSPANLTRDLVWDQLQVDPPVLFFGVEHEFTGNYQEVFVSGGGVTSTTSAARVYYTQAIVEEIVDLEEPVGPDDQIRFDFVFRSFAKYREAFDIPANGSTHGWDLIDIPDNIKRLDNFAVVHIFEDENGKVLNCFYDPPYNVDEQKLITSFPPNTQESYHQSFVQPKLKIQNRGAWTVSEFHIAIERPDTFILDTVYHELHPLEEFTYVGDSLFLGAGKHTIGLYLESIPDQLPEAKIIHDGKQVDYYLYGDHGLPNESFESNSGMDGVGDFMVKDKNAFSFINVSSDTFDLDEPAGAFGLSDRCLMVDFFNWPFDEQNDANNHSTLLYGLFDMPYMDVPKMKFDVAFASEKQFYAILELTIASNNRTKKYKYLESHLATMPEQSTFMRPDSNLRWKTITIDMHDFMGDEDVTLEFRVNNKSKTFNAFYLDNIRVLDEMNFCAPDGLQLTRQSQIDSFKIVYGECNIIQGDLCIGNCDGMTENDIVNLAGLSNLSIIEGDFTLSGAKGLENINHLGQLQGIGGDLTVHANPDLINLSGFNGLYHLGGNVAIHGNSRLYKVGSLGKVQDIPGNFLLEGSPYFGTLEGLEKIRSVEGDLVLRNLPGPFFFEDIESLEYVGGSMVFDSCTRMLRTFTLDKMDTLHGDFIILDSPSLSRVTALPNVQYIEGDLQISNMKAKHLESFGQLDRIGGNLVLKDMDQLETLEAFSNLTEIGGQLRIERADSLRYLDQLEKLRWIHGAMIIRENPSLISIAGIGNLDTLSLTPDMEEGFSLVIGENPVLSVCENAFICGFLDTRPEEVSIMNNDFGCDTIDEVIAGCIVGIQNDLSKRILLHPNPVSRYLRIRLEKMAGFTLVGMDGHLYLEGRLNPGKNQLDVSDIPAGLYLIRLDHWGILRFHKL